mmetsp:Transcript_2858/g.5068  ORF Transcript_2858/g.5068 Transcript_2858/m.5068 type:complete len:83 (-) Transcript_2858:107-355(-)
MPTTRALQAQPSEWLKLRFSNPTLAGVDCHDSHNCSRADFGFTAQIATVDSVDRDVSAKRDPGSLEEILGYPEPQPLLLALP